MGGKKDSMIKQLSVGREITSFKGLNTFLNKAYSRRDELKLKLTSTKGTKRNEVSERLSSLERTIQSIIVEKNVAVILEDASASIETLTDKMKITDPSDINYLKWEDLRDVLSDFSMFDAINYNVKEYLSAVEKIKNGKKLAEEIKERIKKASEIIQDKKADVKNLMSERMIEEASLDGEDITEAVKEMGWISTHLTQMSDSAHPIMRYAHQSILNSFNKTKHTTDEIHSEIESHKKELTKWGKNNGNLSLYEVYGKLIDTETGV
jgi:hypothetical protein